MALNQTQVSQLFVVLFGRAGEGEGNRFWQQGADIATVAEAMLATDAAATYFGTAIDDNADFIKTIFANTFGYNYTDSADIAAGMDFWIDALNSGSYTRGQIVASMIESATTIQNDAPTNASQQFTNRVAVADYMADNVETPAADYATSTKFGVGLIVTHDTATVTAAQATIDGTQTGITFALTANDDTKFGTAGSDTFTATQTTYNSGDLIADSSTSDNDTLTVTATGDITATPTIVGIENVNFNLDAFLATNTTFDVAATNIAGAKTITLDVTKVGTSVVSGQITGLKSGITVVGSDNLTTALTATGGSDNESLTVTGKAAAITANSAGTLTAATITSTSSTTATLTTDSDGTATLTTTVADMEISAASATTVTATSGKGIIADASGGSAALTAATSVTLTALDDVDVSMAAATAATIAAGTVTTSAVSTITDTGSKLVTLNVSGNGSAATFDIQAAAKVATVNISGTQDVTVVADADTITSLTGSKITIVDSSSATSTLSLVVATAAADLSAAAVDRIALTGINSGILTVATGATAVVGVDQTTLKFDGVDASASSNAMTIVLTDGSTAGAVDIATSLTLTDFGAVTIDASTDTVASSITGITASADNTDVTINAGSLGITLAGTNTVGTGDLTINSTGAIALGASVITAAHVTTVGTGAVTWTALDASKAANVTTGDGADVLTISNTAGNLVLATGAGNDSIDLSVIATASKTISIDAGAGTLDTVIIAAADMTTGTSITLSGVERLDFDTGSVTVDNSLLSGQSYIVTNIADTGAVAITVDLGTDTVSDLSTLVIDTAQLASGTDSFVVSGAAATSAVTLTGTLLDDTLTGSAYNDTLVGGAGADTITGGTGNDTITAGEGIDHINAGAGADTIVLTESTSAADVILYTSLSDGSAAGSGAGTFSGFDVVTGFKSGTDSIIFDGGAVDFNTTIATPLSTAGAVVVKASTVATVAANDLTTTNYTDVDTVVNYLNDAGVAYSPTASDVDFVVVTFGTSMSAVYAVTNDATAAVTAAEVKLIGTFDTALVSGDLVIA